MENNKILSLQSLRGLAAISIAFFHLNTGGYISYFFENAWLALDFFFVLSGFVISLNYYDKISSIKNLYIYQKKRFFRLYPLHFLMLILFLGIEFLKLFVEIKFDLIANNKAFSNNDFKAFLANLFLVHNLFLSQPTFNYPSWSISSEFFTYLFFGFLVLFTKKSKTIFNLISVLIILVFGYVLYFTGFESDNITGPIRCIFSFLIGSLTQKLFVILRKKNIDFQSTPSILMLLITVLIIGFFGNKNIGFIVYIPFIFAATILILVLTNEKTVIVKFLNNKFLVYLGTISYGIYLIHAIVWWISNIFLRFIFKYPTETDLNGKTTIILENIFLADLISLIGIFIVIMLAHISFTFFEKKFLK